MFWMDMLRGFAVMLIAVQHTMMFPEMAGVYKVLDLPFIDAINNFFLPGRVPALIFLSGILLNKSLRKTGWNFFEGKIHRILIPFLIWTAIEYIRRYIYGDVYFLNVYGIIKIFVHPFYWYLEYLFIFYIFAYVFRRVHPAIMASVVFIAALLSWIFVPAVMKPLYFLTFFMLGAAVGTDFSRFKVLDNLRFTIPMIIGMFLVGTLSILTGGYWGDKYPPFIPLHVVFLLGFISLIYVVHDHGVRVLDFASWVGRRSIVFYVVHPLIGCLVFTAISHFTSLSFYTSVLTTLVLTIVLSVLAGKLQDWKVTRWLFIGFPQKR